MRGRLRITRTALRCGLVLALGLGVLGGATAAYPGPAAPEGCVVPNRTLTLHAVQLPSVQGQVRLAYGLTPSTATIPGPTIELVEGDCLALTVVNAIPAKTLAAMRDDPVSGDGHTPLGISAHPHGVKYLPGSDGTVHTGSFVPPGSARTFLWYAAPQVHVGKRVASLGTAGYWWYHDHIAGTTHGTGGVGAGLFGALIVRRAGDVPPDRTFVIGMGDDATLNLVRHPQTDCAGPDALPSNRCLVARLGERVELVVIGMGNDFHTFHLHGHSWADTRTGALAGPHDDSRVIDNRTVGPADSFGFQVIAGESVGVGSWMLHCHVQGHSDRHMSTFFHVTSDGRPPASGGGHGHG